MAQMTRRDFMAGAAAAGAVIAAPNILAKGTMQDRIKVGLIGCGGRGTGATVNAVQADPGVVITAMGDAFKDRLDGSRSYLSGQIKERLQVTDDRAFVGFDAYQKVIAQDVDYVILATPPGFRPIHFEAAIAAGKHVFFEKPVAVDAPGIRKVIAAAESAKAKGLAVVAGTQRRHERPYMECMDRIHNGQMGDVVATYAYWNQGGLWMNKKEPGWSELEWQMRNWLYFTWLSGDHIVEQHVHNLDVSNWAKNGHPVKCFSLAGRQVRTDANYGHIFDHFATEYEYEDGSKMMSTCRQIDGCYARVSEHIVGTKGTSDANNWIRGENPWRWDGRREDPYMLEHKDMIASIRAGTPLNEGVQVAHSTLTAIMGRMSAYTGKEVTWDAALNSQETLVPAHFEFGMKLEVPPVAVPGTTTIL
ncbi:MAG: Gfo/Idh/MocA family oxidoreductase [Fimbriimonadaceae bacterium]